MSKFSFWSCVSVCVQHPTSTRDAPSNANNENFFIEINLSKIKYDSCISF